MYMYHRLLKISTDGSRAGVRELGSIGFWCLLFRAKCGPFVTKFIECLLHWAIGPGR